MVDDQLSTRLEDSIKKSFRSYTVEFKKKAKDERNRYIDLVKKSLKEIIKDEVMNQLPKILLKEVSNYSTHNLTQEHLVRPAFNLLKGTCKSRVELEYHFKECYKAVTVRLDWTNPEGHKYPFDLSKPLPIIEDQDVNVRLIDTKHEEQGEEDEEITDAGHDDSTYQTK
nr:hypothetical protein [Tanacetum cinerariifolium]